MYYLLEPSQSRGEVGREGGSLPFLTTALHRLVSNEYAMYESTQTKRSSKQLCSCGVFLAGFLHAIVAL